MEKIIKNTKFLPINNILLLNFDEILIFYNDELHNLNNIPFNVFYVNDILIKAKTVDYIEKYYRINDFFIIFYLYLFKKISKNDRLLVSINNNKVIPKDFHSLECIKKSINIVCKNYLYNIFICFFSDLLYIGANDIDILRHIIKKIKINTNINIMNDIFLYNKDFKIIYKKLI